MKKAILSIFAIFLFTISFGQTSFLSVILNSIDFDVTNQMKKAWIYKSIAISTDNTTWNTTDCLWCGGYSIISNLKNENGSGYVTSNTWMMADIYTITWGVPAYTPSNGGTFADSDWRNSSPDTGEIIEKFFWANSAYSDIRSWGNTCNTGAMTVLWLPYGTGLGWTYTIPQNTIAIVSGLAYNQWTIYLSTCAALVWNWNWAQLKILKPQAFLPGTWTTTTITTISWYNTIIDWLYYDGTSASWTTVSSYAIKTFTNNTTVYNNTINNCSFSWVGIWIEIYGQTPTKRSDYAIITSWQFLWVTNIGILITVPAAYTGVWGTTTGTYIYWNQFSVATGMSSNGVTWGDISYNIFTWLTYGADLTFTWMYANVNYNKFCGNVADWYTWTNALWCEDAFQITWNVIETLSFEHPLQSVNGIIAWDATNQCNSTSAGLIKFSGSNFFGCNGTSRAQLDN
jgi:hypothetical protein